MDIAYSCVLLFLATTFVYTGLLILHGLRRVIGNAGLYLAIGMLFIFIQLAGTAGLRIDTGLPGMNFDLMSTNIMLPVLAMLMVIYISDGTLAAQRIIIGMMAGLGLYVYLAKLTGITDLVINTGEPSVFTSLINRSLQAMAASSISFALDIFLIPIFYQGLRNLKCRLFIAVMGALVLVQLCDGIFYVLLCNLGKPGWWQPLKNFYLANMLSALWLSAMSSFYLSRIPKENPGSGKNPLDIIIAFFGHYGKAKKLEEHLKRSEERYRLLFEHAGDMVMTIDGNGEIHHANEATIRLTGLHDPRLKFSELTGMKQADWQHCDSAVMRVMPLTGRIVELTFTPFRPDGVNGPMEYIVFGRDVTDRIKLEKELADMHIRAEHNQRLESIGRLAGGIAHDFNNYLHAIQGHLDLIRYMYPVENENVERHLEKIDSITDKASLLTRQMLSFARKGDYMKTVQDPAQLILATLEMFPVNSHSIQMTCNVTAPSPFRVEADAVQIQQAVLNILINARDAMNQIPVSDRFLEITLFAAEAEMADFQPDPPDEAGYRKDQPYCVIRISDSGPGIPDKIRHRIMEPFFTTKPVGKGTGMGLAMAYGLMLSHKGWLQCRNAKNGGAVFELIFPLC